MSKQTFVRPIVPFPYVPPSRAARSKQPVAARGPRIEEERLDSPNSLFWRGIWMLVF